MESVSLSTTSANQYGMQQAMRQVARLNTDQAGQVVHSLKAQAGETLRAADRAEEKARFLQAQLLQFRANDTLREADRVEAKARVLSVRETNAENVQPSNTDQKAATQLSAINDQIGSRQPDISTTNIAPLVNGQNQVVGVFINTTA